MTLDSSFDLAGSRQHVVAASRSKSTGWLNDRLLNVHGKNLRLFQALCQWRIEKAGGRRAGSGREKGSSSSPAESLEQAIKTSDETKIQMFADWSMSHAKLVTTGQ